MFDDEVQAPPASLFLQPGGNEVEVNETELPEIKPAEPQENSQARDWRNVREKAARAERERDDAIRRTRELEAYVQQQNNPQQPKEDYEINIRDDELAEGKHLSKMGRQVKELKAQVESYQKQNAQATAQALIQSKYPDFYKVVNSDTLARLQAEEPEAAQTLLNASSDVYNSNVTAYKMIKKLGIYQEDLYGDDRERVQKNAAKPKALASISPQQGDSPLSRANAFAQGLTKDVKDSLWKEMQEAMKNR